MDFLKEKFKVLLVFLFMGAFAGLIIFIVFTVIDIVHVVEVRKELSPYYKRSYQEEFLSSFSTEDDMDSSYITVNYYENKKFQKSIEFYIRNSSLKDNTAEYTVYLNCNGDRTVFDIYYNKKDVIIKNRDTGEILFDFKSEFDTYDEFLDDLINIDFNFDDARIKTKINYYKGPTNEIGVSGKLPKKEKVIITFKYFDICIEMEKMQFEYKYYTYKDYTDINRIVIKYDAIQNDNEVHGVIRFKK